MAPKPKKRSSKRSSSALKASKKGRVVLECERCHVRKAVPAALEDIGTKAGYRIGDENKANICHLNPMRVVVPRPEEIQQA